MENGASGMMMESVVKHVVRDFKKGKGNAMIQNLKEMVIVVRELITKWSFAKTTTVKVCTLIMSCKSYFILIEILETCHFSL